MWYAKGNRILLFPTAKKEKHRHVERKRGVVYSFSTARGKAGHFRSRGKKKVGRRVVLLSLSFAGKTIKRYDHKEGGKKRKKSLGTNIESLLATLEKRKRGGGRALFLSLCSGCFGGKRIISSVGAQEEGRKSIDVDLERGEGALKRRRYPLNLLPRRERKPSKACRQSREGEYFVVPHSFPGGGEGKSWTQNAKTQGSRGKKGRGGDDRRFPRVGEKHRKSGAMRQKGRKESFTVMGKKNVWLTTTDLGRLRKKGGGSLSIFAARGGKKAGKRGAHGLSAKKRKGGLKIDLQFFELGEVDHNTTEEGGGEERSSHNCIRFEALQKKKKKKSSATLGRRKNRLAFVYTAASEKRRTDQDQWGGGGEKSLGSKGKDREEGEESSTFFVRAEN